MSRSFLRWSICALVMALVFGWIGSAVAHEVTPMRLFLVPSEGRSQSNITINNIRSEPLTYEVRALQRLVEPDGTERLEEADDAFIIFPPQGEVPAGATQGVHLQYVGAPVDDKALSYVIQVVEVPIEQPGFSGVRFTYNFGVAVYVEPSRALERISISAIERTASGIKLVVRNEGNKFALLNTRKLLLWVGGVALEVTSDQMAESGINPLLPPGMDRLFNIEIADLPIEGDLRAEFRAQ